MRSHHWGGIRDWPCPGQRISFVSRRVFGRCESAHRFWCSQGLRLVLVDINDEDLKHAHDEIAGMIGPQNVLAVKTDVSKLDEVEKRESHANLRDMPTIDPSFA